MSFASTSSSPAALGPGAPPLLLAALDALPIQVWTARPDGSLDFVNRRVREDFALSASELAGFGWLTVLHPEDVPATLARWRRSLETGEPYETSFRVRSGAEPRYRWHLARAEAQRGSDGRPFGWIGTNTDVEALETDRVQEVSQRRALEALIDVNRRLSAELEPGALVQAVTDAGRLLTGADFAAFFSSAEATKTGAYPLYTLSGAHRGEFAALPMPRATPFLATTLVAQQIVRVDDVRTAAGFGAVGPHHGLPKGHPPVRSYLGVPVISRHGHTLGALLFGHAEPGRFDASTEALAWGLASQAAIALDTAQAYAAAQREKAQRNAVLAQIAEGVIVADPSGQIVFVNEAARRIHGAAREVGVDEYASAYQLHTMEGELYPTDQLPLARAVRGDEAVLSARWRIVRPDGREVVAEGSAVPFRGEQGEKLGAVLTIRDVTEACAAEAARECALRALRASEERYRSLIDASAQIVWTNTPDGRMEGPQPGWAALTGQTEAEYGGLGWAEALHPADRAPTLRLWNEAVLSRRVFLCTHRVKNQAGEYREFSVRGVPVLEADGRVREWVGVHTDVTAQRRAEREREALIQALEASNRELDQFAYVASHDLKAPLRGITNLSTFIEEDLGDAVTPEVRGHLTLMRGRVQRMEALIEGILAYARAGRAEPEAGEIDVQALLRETVELLSPPAPARIRVESELNTLYGGRTQLQQVLLNLLGNALKYGRKPDGEVAVRVQDRGDHAELSVTDDGPGIAPEFQARIWGIFQRLKARDEEEGTGIGLSVVRKIVEARGQRVWLRSEPGRGATFAFTWDKQPRSTR